MNTNTNNAGRSRPLRLISWNLLHRTGACVDDIADLIMNWDPDIFVMQEVTTPIDGLQSHVEGEFSRQEWPGKAHGLAVWSKRPLCDIGPMKLPASKLPGSLPIRFAQIFSVNEITVANVHLSHGQILNRRQLNWIARNTNGPTVIVGDFNLIGTIRVEGFRDAGPRGSTHHAQQVLPFRLDRCLVRQIVCRHTKTLQRGPSDHRPILAEISADTSHQRVPPKLAGSISHL
ncbi:MAG: endonuclease/exonuclease/phosphatase family protein [Rhizobiaceae bacterium]